MRKYHAGPIRNADLAELAHMNVNSFSRLFRQATGETPQAHLTRLRVEEACVLLHEAALAIPDVAEATGFCDRYHFTRVFRKGRGMTPGAFRRMLAAGQ